MAHDKKAIDLNKMIKDLTGQDIPLKREIPKSAVDLLSSKSSRGLGYSQFNELLLYLGYDRVSHAFFQFLVDRTTEYKSRASLKTLTQFRTGVDEFRKIALLFFGNVKYAFKNLSGDVTFLENHLARFDKRRKQNFKDRHKQISPPKLINGNDTYYLGYVVQDELAAKLKKNPNDRKVIGEENKRLQIVERGKQNHDAYLVSDHLDVYIATSMRERHEYLMVYETTRAIFSHPILRNLRLRYFDPTQAYCIDRIDKGLAEGLMLRRAKCTIYFAQESDTFGKDSELASTLAQGKVVIAYVPRPGKNVAKKLIDLLAPRGSNYQKIILRQLQLQEPDAAWTDPQIKEWVRSPGKLDRSKGIARLQAAIERQFKKRDKLLREIHPLGIQVNLKSGVANGVLVVNTVEQCAKLVRGIMLRELRFDLETEKKNSGEYLFLREKISKSIFRVVTGEMMLTNAFWNFYLNPRE
jgi:hypothetical protein